MERATIRALSLASLLFSGVAFGGLTDLEDWGVKPNLGVDAGFKDQSFSAGFGREQFRKHYPETNIYFGAKFHPYVGMEVGYEHMYLSQRKQYYPQNSSVLGFLNPVVVADRFYLSDVYSQGWNLNLLGFWPICPRTKTEIMGTIGIAWLKMYYSTWGSVEGNFNAGQIANWESDDRAMLKLGLGIRQMITKHFGARLNAYWEDTSKLGATIPVPVTQGGVADPTVLSDNYTVRPRDSYSVLLGFFFQIT